MKSLNELPKKKIKREDLKNYVRGGNCSCGAWGQTECGCGADWTPKKLYELEFQVKDLEKKLICMIEYVENDCACMIPIERFFNKERSGKN